MQTTAIKESGVVEVPVGQIHPNRWNPNVLSEEDRKELKDSIANSNCLDNNPIRVRPLASGEYEIIDGEKRWEAVQQLGRPTIPCIVMEVEESKAMELTVMYDKDRGTIHPVRMGKLLSVFYRPYSKEINQEELARRFGCSQARIANFIRTYEALPEAEKYSLTNTSGSVLEEVASVKDPRLRSALLEAVSSGDERVTEAGARSRAKDLNRAIEVINEAALDPEKREQLVQEVVSSDLVGRGNVTSEVRRKVERLLIKNLRPTELEGLVFGDCREEMKKLQEGSAALVLTDVPFCITEEMAMHRRANPMKFNPKLLASSEEDRQFDVFENEDEYLKLMRDWMGEALRVLKPGGHCVVFVDRLKITEFVKIGESLGFDIRQPLYWRILNPVPNSDERDFTSAIMTMAWFTRPVKDGEKPTFHYELGQHPNYFDAPYVSGTEKLRHPSAKPISLLKEIIEYLTNAGDLIVDPFAGGGSTLEAALELERRAWGAEKNETSYKMAAERLATVRNQPTAV
jgi:ParB/RepB/Spo0J family partition protein